jgi:hypothetical protein
MGDFFLGFVFKKIADSIDGYKMYILGTISVLRGIMGLLGHYKPTWGIAGEDVKVATDEIMYGLSLIAGKSAIVKSGPTQ